MGPLESRRLGWAWTWLICISGLGWAPAIAVSYAVALALNLGMGFKGPGLHLVYALLTATGLFLSGQVKRFFRITGRPGAWFTFGGGALLVAVWWLALAMIF